MVKICAAPLIHGNAQVATLAGFFAGDAIVFLPHFDAHEIWRGRAPQGQPSGDHRRRGVDIVVAQGYEAGGHTGEIASMVLVPEIVDAVGALVPVLAAGGIGCGRQIAAALTLGAVGVWMGSAWLTTEEYALTSDMAAVRTALLAATSSDTVRSRIYSGKPARLLKNRWTQAWAEPGAPEPLPMPLQNLLVSEAHQRLMRSDQPDVVPMPVGRSSGG